MGVNTIILQQILKQLHGHSSVDDSETIHVQKVFPYDTLGAVIVCGNTVWGDLVEVVAIDDIVADYGWNGGATIPYSVVGIDIVSKSNPTVQCVLQFMRVVKSTVQTLDVDSGLGETPADRIYVPSTGDFLVGDWVWVFDTDDTGELIQIESIATDDYLDTDGNLTKLYETAKAAKVYRIRRVSDHGEYKSIWISFSAASTKEMQHIDFHAHRPMENGDGIIARGISSEAGTPEVYVAVVYDDI